MAEGGKHRYGGGLNQAGFLELGPLGTAAPQGGTMLSGD